MIALKSLLWGTSNSMGSQDRPGCFRPHDTCRSVKRIPKMHLRKDSPLLPQLQCSAPDYLCWGLTITKTAETQTFQCWAKKWGASSSKQELRKTQLSKVAGQQQHWNIHPSSMGQHASPQNYCHGWSRGFWRKKQRILCCPIDPRDFQGVRLS